MEKKTKVEEVKEEPVMTDLEKRSALFQAGLKKLIEEHQVTLVAKISPDGPTMQVMDIKKESPIVTP